MKIVLKSGTHAGQSMEEVIALAKGLIEPGDLTYGGVIPPQQASKIIDMVFDDPFLSQITTENMDRLQKSVDVLGAEGRQLVRINEGAEPVDDDLASAYESGDQFNALPVQLFPSIKLSWLRANQHNPKLLQMLEQVFVKVMRRDFVDLGFNGIADTGAGATRAEKFLNLNKGWVQLAKDAANSPKIDIDAATDTWTATLAAIRVAANDDYRSESVFVMSTADADNYALELGAHVTGTLLTAESPLRRFQGTKIVAHDKMPAGHVLFTPLYNLAFGLHNRIERTRQFHARKRVMEYTFDQATDYQIAVKQACVLGKPA